jgi:hypothetical protein
VPLKKALAEITPGLVGYLKALRGRAVFNPLILKQNPGDEIAAFHGLNCCRIASKYVGNQLALRGIEGFKQVSDSQNQHSFLVSDSDGEMLDATWRQLFSFAVMDYLFERCLFSKDEEIRQLALTHAASGNKLIKHDLVEKMQADIAKRDIVAHFDLPEMQKLLDEFGEKRKEAYQFTDKLNTEMQRELLGMFDFFDRSKFLPMDVELPRPSSAIRDSNPAQLRDKSKEKTLN